MTPKIVNPKNILVAAKNFKAFLQWATHFGRKWNGRYSKAQKWLDSEVLRTTEPFVPLLTGTLIKTGILATVPGLGLVTWITPYARRQYYSPRAPGSQTGLLRGPHWFHRSKSVHKRAWIAGAKKIAGRG
jgi:hypothetical protein